MDLTSLKNKTLLILVSILPIGFVIGPLIVEIIISILVINLLIEVYYKKKFFIFKNKIFIFFLVFYLYLIFNVIVSDFFKESALNIFFYIRFILFPFAIYLILKKNTNNLMIVFIVMSLTFFIVVLDGYFQFFFDRNFLGYEKYRPDRISGFFKDDLILGSFLSRLLPLFLALIILFKKNLLIFRLNLILFFLIFFLIFLTGERAAFILSVLGLLIIIFQIKSFSYLKFIFFTIAIITILLLIIKNPILSSRYVDQIKHQTFTDSNQNNILPNYMPMIKTSLKMFNENKLLGMGPKSFRYLCSDSKFVSYFPNLEIIDNTKLKIKKNWKELGYYYLDKFYVSEGDLIEKGQKIFSYRLMKQDESIRWSHKIQFYFSDKEGKILQIIKKERYSDNDLFLILEPKKSPSTEYYYRNACNTHPHNFYIQLIAETGIIGLVFISMIFIYLFFLIAKNSFYRYFRKLTYFSDSQICILVGFFIVLWPITTNGNFFNNFINLISFYPLGFLLYINDIELKK